MFNIHLFHFTTYFPQLSEFTIKFRLQITASLKLIILLLQILIIFIQHLHLPLKLMHILAPILP